MEPESIPVYTNTLFIPVSDDMLRDFGILPDDFPPLPLPSRRELMRDRFWSAYWGARWWVAERVAGQDIGCDHDEW